MAIWNLGSINVDHVYRVPHLPAPGETLAALSYATGLGGKGANQSVAAARAGARVCHIGAVGAEGGWALRKLGALGVDLAHVAEVAPATGHAIINVDPLAENAIVIYAGANVALTEGQMIGAMALSAETDTVLLQNETNLQVETAREARARGLRVIYSAAPFSIAAVQAVLSLVSLLVMNEGEASALVAALGQPLDALPVAGVIVTKGSRGAEWISAGTETLLQPSFAVTPVDTTGAGDCFIGSLAAALDRGDGRAAAMRYAAAAAALQVTRPGAADAMPTRAEVEAFLATQP
ncbi:MAG: ribokinase [Rhodobacteraceae bacterium]|nr:ribokinase [Paracoccaceae bacterium]